jgi:hypothetical protein
MTNFIFRKIPTHSIFDFECDYNNILHFLNDELEKKLQSHISINTVVQLQGMRSHSWFRHCPTCQKVADLISDEVIEIFHWLNPSSRSMALGSTQPLTEMSISDISWRVKAAGV